MIIAREGSYDAEDIEVLEMVCGIGYDREYILHDKPQYPWVEPPPREPKEVDPKKLQAIYDEAFNDMIQKAEKLNADSVIFTGFWPKETGIIALGTAVKFKPSFDWGYYGYGSYLRENRTEERQKELDQLYEEYLQRKEKEKKEQQEQQGEKP